MRQTVLAATLVFALAACTGDDAAEDASSGAGADAAAASAGAPDAGGAAAAGNGTAAAGKDGKSAAVYSQTFTHKRQSYLVEVGSGVTRSTVTITPKGLGLSNKVFRKDVDGLFTRAEMADIDVDGEPEIYVFMQSPEGLRKGTAIILASDQGRRVVEVAVPNLASDVKNSAGYRGGDEFAIVENVLARRFPLYDDSGEPTGTMRQLQYKLVRGDSGLEFKLHHSAEF